MEVEVMKANNRKQAEMTTTQQDWPMNCICNLCSCGSHSCASFNDNIDQDDNRCRRVAAKRISMKRMDSTQREQDQRGELDELTHEATDGLHNNSCANHQFDSGERYLAANLRKRGSPGAGTKRGDSEDEAAAAAAAELVRVLVTRPEIASKPRDNIIFEGDMDLRTTFETSYEALAKMRLDQWRKYQEATKNSSQNKTVAPNQKRSTIAHKSPSFERDVDGGREGDEMEQQAAGEQEQQQYQHPKKDVSSKPTISSLGNNSSSSVLVVGKDHRRQREIRGFEPQTPRSRTPFAVADTNLNNIHDAADWDYHYNLNQSSRHQLIGKSDPQQQLQSQQQQQQQQQSQQRQQRQVITDQDQQGQETIGRTTPKVAAESPSGPEAQNTTANYVDPDLAPIIVYDANMNRLERVGMRKRSKYRPSTSLRSGARGLFGDQVPEKEANHSGRVSRGEDKAMQTDDRIVAKTGQERDDVSVSRTQVAGASRGGISMGSRNLGNSPINQTPDRLVYSERNVPVNTKRRVQDNINMRDNVREQNIVDGGRYELAAAAVTTPSPSRPEHSKVNENAFYTHPPGDGDLDVEEFKLERDLADIRLAEQEEAAANAEIQRVAALDPLSNVATSGGPPSQKPGSSLLIHHRQDQLSRAGNSTGAGVTGDGSETRTSSRQSRLQRTCQEQSFHIGQNDYPTAEPIERVSPNLEAKFKSSAMNSSHASPQTRVYSNLFSESPDFILTTGGKPGFMMTTTTTNDTNNNATDSAADDNNRRLSSREQLRYTTNTFRADEPSSDRLIDSRNDMTDGNQALLAEASSSVAAGIAAPFADHHHRYQDQDQYQPYGIINDRHASTAGLDNNDDGECRVTKLGERFQYVGSRSGHQYYVEKILDSH